MVINVYTQDTLEETHGITVGIDSFWKGDSILFIVTFQ